MSGISVSVLVDDDRVRTRLTRLPVESLGDLLACRAHDRNPSRAALFACDDSNSRYGHLQTFGQQSSQRLVRTIIDGRRSQLYFCRPLMFARDPVAARSGRNPHGKYNLVSALLNFNQRLSLRCRTLP
jgi:hypothetical protein